MSEFSQEAEAPPLNIRKPHPIDLHVGSNMRMIRILRRLSQEQLGRRADLTFQQIQKYEKGTNRLSASRLWQFSNILDVPIERFFDDAPAMALKPVEGGRSTDESLIMELVHSPGGMDIVRAVARIKDNKVRKRLLLLARALANQEDEKAA